MSIWTFLGLVYICYKVGGFGNTYSDCLIEKAMFKASCKYDKFKDGYKISKPVKYEGDSVYDRFKNSDI